MQPLTILLVDDHADSALASAVFLRRDGHGVRVAHGFAEALAAAGALGPIDVLVSDITLPDGDGCALLRHLNERRGGGPRLAVAITGHVEPHWAEQCRKAGYHRFLPKPVAFQELLAAVREATPAAAGSLGGVPAPARAFPADRRA